MSFTLATLKTAVQDYMESSETTFTTQLNTLIKEAENRIFDNVQLPVQRKNVQGSTTASNRFLATPTDFYAPFSAAIITGSRYYYLDFKHPSFIKEYSPTTTVTGRPKYYSLLDDTAFELSPIPDANYTLEHVHAKYPTSIVTAGGTYLGDNFDTALLNGTLM